MIHRIKLVSVQLGNPCSDRYKRCWMVQYFNTQFTSNFKLNPKSLRNSSKSQMSDINATRLPGLGFVPWWPAYVGDDVNPTLIRGDK